MGLLLETAKKERKSRREKGCGADLVDGRVHGVGADRALEQLVHAGGRRYERPRGGPAPRDDDHVHRRRRGGGGGGGRLEEGAGEVVGHGGFVVGEGHALDAVHHDLHGPEQIEPNRARRLR